MLERKIRYCSLPEAIRDHFLWGARSIVLAGTHGKTTTTSLTGWLLTHGGLDPTVLVGGIALNFGDGGSSYRRRRRPRLRHRGRRVRQRLLRQDGEVPQVPARRRRDQQHRVRPRRHLRRPRRGAAGVPPARQPGAAQRPAAARRRQPARGARCSARRSARSRRSASATARLAGARTSSTRDGVTRFDGAAATAQPFGRVRVAAARRCTTCATRWRRLPSAPTPALGAATLADGLRQFKGIKRRLETVGVGGGVTVLDDFAHHPTAVHETLSALRTGYPARRIWAVFEPRSASSCRRVFQDDFARGVRRRRRSGRRRRCSARRCRSRSACPPSSSSTTCAARGQRARHIPDVDDIIRTIVARAPRRRRRRADVQRRLRRHPPKLLQALAA